MFIFLKLTSSLHKRCALTALTLIMGIMLVEVCRLQISEIYRIKAMNALDEKNYGMAEESMLNALAIDGDNEMLYLGLGNIYHAISEQSSPQLETLNKSKQAYLSVIARNPFLAKAWFGLARNREKIHRFLSLNQNSKTLSDSSGNIPDTELNNSTWKEETKDYFRRTISEDPNNVFYMMNYSLFLLRIDRYDEAKALYRQTYKIAPEVINGHYLTSLGNNRVFNRMVEESFWEEIGRNPKNYDPYYFLGRWYISQGLYAHALSVFRKAKYSNQASKLTSHDQEYWVPRIERQIRKAELLIRKRIKNENL